MDVVLLRAVHARRRESGADDTREGSSHRLDGDHHGDDGFRCLSERLQQDRDTGFHNEPHPLTPYGDELAYATNTVSFSGTEIDVDAILVWRIVDGHIAETWDIPAITTVRPHRSGAG